MGEQVLIADFLPLLEYGFVAIALYMMYDIAANRLEGIQATLIRIELLLSEN